MYFGKLVRIIVSSFLIFVLAILIVEWISSIQLGMDDFQYHGFYSFMKHLEEFPNFDFFLESLKDFRNLFTDWSGWQIGLAIVTLGVSKLVEFTWYVTKAVSMLFFDFFRIIVWLIGFFGNYEISV